MRYILARANRHVLRRHARSQVLLAFDFDGTLARIVPDPETAVMRISTRRLLAALAERYPCVFVSGRARADVRRRLAGVRALEVFGNHGIEPWQVSARALRAVRRWQPLLARRLAGLRGVVIEDKTYSLSIHYRHARDKARALAAVRAAAAELGDARLIPGQQVLNLLPSATLDKGTALLEAQRRFHCDAALYVGDDETDEDIFALERRGCVLTIRVGRRRDSLAAYYIRDQSEIDELLRRLLVLRHEPGRRAVAAW